MSASLPSVRQGQWAGEEAEGALHFLILKRFYEAGRSWQPPRNRTWSLRGGCANTCGRSPAPAEAAREGPAGGRGLPGNPTLRNAPPHPPSRHPGLARTPGQSPASAPPRGPLRSVSVKTESRGKSSLSSNWGSAREPEDSNPGPGDVRLHVGPLSPAWAVAPGQATSSSSIARGEKSENRGPSGRCYRGPGLH